MYRGKTVACVIPARLKSSRFPRKMLLHICGKPMLRWIWEAALQIPWFDSVQFAVDSDEVYDLVRSFGGSVFRTSELCRCGTERLAELAVRGSVRADIWVNWQGDEPLVGHHLVADLLQTCDDDEVDVWTLRRSLTVPEELASPHIAKVVTDHHGRALYFSRSPIPYTFPDDTSPPPYYKHVGMYAIRAPILHQFATWGECDVERAERLEQLRFLHHGLHVRVHDTNELAMGVDLPEQVPVVERYLEQKLALNMSCREV